MNIKIVFLQEKTFDKQICVLHWRLSLDSGKRFLQITSCAWYLIVIEELIKLGIVCSNTTRPILHSKLFSIITTLVDKFCFYATLLFHTAIMNSLCKAFKVKSLKKLSPFMYIGLNIKKNRESIIMSRMEMLKTVGN